MFSCTFCSTVVFVSLEREQYTVAEGDGSLSVCAQMMGDIERNEVTVAIITTDNTALSKALAPDAVRFTLFYT